MANDINARVVEIIAQFVQNSKQFTILDITEAVKLDGGDYVRHQDVRPVAKPILDKLLVTMYSDYEVANIVVETTQGPVSANLYIPFGTNPEDYKDRKKAASKPANVATQPGLATGTGIATGLNAPQTTPAVPACTQNARWWVIKNLRSDGAVEIPIQAFEEAFGCAIDAIDGVGVNIHPNSISVEAGQDRYVTNNGFRISVNDLRKANLGSKGKLTICAFRDKVVLC